METRASVYQVLDSNSNSTIHGEVDRNGGYVTTTHTTGAWVKDVATGKVEQLNLTNTNIPLRPGATIGIGFGGGYPLVFKRSPEIPCENSSIAHSIKSRGQSLKMVLLIALLTCLPFVGWVGGAVFGAVYFLLPTVGERKGFGVADGHRVLGAVTLVTSLLMGKGLWDAVHAQRFVESYLGSTVLFLLLQVVINYVVLTSAAEKSRKIVAAAREKLEMVVKQQAE